MASSSVTIIAGLWIRLAVLPSSRKNPILVVACKCRVVCVRVRVPDETRRFDLIAGSKIAERQKVKAHTNIRFQALYFSLIDYATGSCLFLFFDVRPSKVILGRGLQLNILLAVVETGPDRPQGAAQRCGRPDAGHSCTSEPKISTGHFFPDPDFEKNRRTTLTHTCPAQLAELRLSH